MCCPIDNSLRRINAAGSADFCVNTLADCEMILGQRIAPAQIIPAGDGECQHNNAVVARISSDQVVCRRAGGAALTCEEFDDGS